MKVLYLGHYKEQTGWAKAAKDNILALATVGIDVVCRNIQLTNQNAGVQELVEFERKECYDATHCIQHVLPHYYVGTDKYEKNIGYFVSETDSTKYLSWNSHLSLVDELWVPNHIMKKNLEYEGFKVGVVPHTCKPSVYAQEYEPISIPEIDHTYKFYTICDFNDRKNLETMIRCFHSTFDPSDPVSLIIKVSMKGQDPKKLKAHVHKMCEDIKSRMRMYKDPSLYHQEVVITEHMSDEDIMRLHKYGDTFVNLSHGEAWSIPTFDALCFGNKPIITSNTGMDYYCNRDNSYKVQSFKKVCESASAAFPELFTGRDYWLEVNDYDVSCTMKTAYNAEQKEKHLEQGIKIAKMYSYRNVGETMEKLLNE